MGVNVFSMVYFVINGCEWLDIPENLIASQFDLKCVNEK